MNEEYIKDMFDLTGLESQNVTLEQFREKALSGDEAFLADMFDLTGLSDQGVTVDQFSEGFSGKKKEQDSLQGEPTQQVEQESMESASETGSSELQEDIDLNNMPLAGIDDPTSLDVSSYSAPENKPLTVDEVEMVKAKAEEVVTPEYVKDKFGTDFLGVTPDQLSSVVRDEYPELYNSDIENILFNEKNKLLSLEADKNYKSTIDSIKSSKYSDLDDEAATRAAKQDINEATTTLAFGSLGLNEEEVAEFKDAIFNASNGLREVGDLKAQLNKLKKPDVESFKTKEEYLKAFKDYSENYNSIVSDIRQKREENQINLDKISVLREDKSAKAFTDAEGNVNKELKEEIENKVAQFDKEYKSDYAKIFDRLTKEKSKMESLKEKFLSDLTPEQYDKLGGVDRVINEGTAQEQVLGAKATVGKLFSDVTGETLMDYYDPSLKKKAESFVDMYREADKNFQALSRLALLNEDPAKVERGWGTFGDIPLLSSAVEWVGEVGASFGETLFEARTGNEYASDKDYRESVVSILQEEGIKLTPEQIAAGETLFSEKLGDALGISGDIGIDIMMTKGFMGAASKMINLPKYLAKIEKLRNSPKLVKFLDGLGDVLMEGAAFQLASDQTDFFMGAAEGTSNKAFDALISKVSGSKYGKFLKVLDNFAGRFAKEVVGRSTGGVIEEYSGDLFSNLAKFGITEEAFKETFGEGEAGLEKFFLTLGSVGMMTAPTSIVAAAKKKAENEPDGALAKAIKLYEESQGIEPTKTDVKAGLEILKENDSNTVSDLTEEQEKVLTEDQELEEIEKNLEIVEEPTAEETTIEPVSEETVEQEVVTEAELIVETEPTTEVEGDTFTEEELEAPEVENTLKSEQKKVKNISKAISKIAPGVEFVFHKTSESYNNSSDIDVSDSRGYRDGNKIHIDLTSVKDNTSFHEAIHPVLDAVFEKSPETYNKLVSAMKSDPEFQSYFEAAKRDYKTENTQVNEALTEMMSDVANGKYAEGSSVYQKVKDFVKEILAKLGLRQSDFNIDLNKEVDVRQFAETIGKALAKGKEITFKQEDRLVESPTDVNFQKKGKRPDTIRKESQKEFKKEIDSVISKLSEAQRKTARGLLVGVKDAKTLAEAKVKLDNLVKYGAVNPSVKTKVKSKPGKTYQVISDSSLNKALLKAETEGAKGLSKAQKELVKDLRDKIKSLGSQSQSVINSIAKRLVNVNPSSPSSVLELHDYLDKVKADSDYIAKRNNIKSAQSKLSSKIKSVGKKIKTGKRFEKAKALAKMNLNRLDSLDGVEEVLEEVINSLSGKEGSFDNVSEEIDMLLNEEARNERKFRENKQRIMDEMIAEEYDQSPLSKEMSFEEYKKKAAEAINNAKAEEAISLKEEQDFKMRDWLANRIQALKLAKSSITKDMTSREKAIVDTLIRNIDLIKRKDLISSEDIIKLSNAVDEIISYESTSGTNLAAVTLESIKNAVNSKRELKNAIDKKSRFAQSDFTRFGRLINDNYNLSSLLRSITISKKAANKLGYNTVAKFNSGHSTAKQEHRAFNLRLKERSKKYGIKEKESFRIGVVSRLRQNALGLTEEQKTKDLQDKLEALNKEAETLLGSVDKAEKTLGKKLKAALDSLKLDDVETKADLLSKLSKNEQNWLTETEEEFASVQSDLQETYRNSKGQELELEENYMPLFATVRSGKEKDIDAGNYYNGSLDTDASGRTIKRRSVDKSGNTTYNYDIIRTSSEGYYQNRYDVNTLYHRQVLNSLVKSKPFKKLLGGENSETNNLYKNFINSLSTIMDARKRTTSIDDAKKSEMRKIMNRLYRATVVMPLKTSSQIVKQPISIIVNTLVRSPKTTSDSFIYTIQAQFPNREKGATVKKLLSFSNVPMRDTLGDLDFESAQGLSEYLTGKIPANNVSIKILKAMGSDALRVGDMLATQGSWIAFYMDARAKQEGKGFKFDMEKEAANPNMEAVNAANMESDVVNNISDSTSRIGKGIEPVFKEILLLFKSFTINQNINAFIDMKNIKTDTANSLKNMAGTFLSIMAFNMIKDLMVKQFQEMALEALTDFEDDDDLQEIIEENIFSWAGESIVDMFLGGLPDTFINDILYGYVVNGIGTLAGAEEDIVKVYKRTPGVIGLIEGYSKGFIEDLDILTYTGGDDVYYSEDMKLAAWADLLGLMLMDGNLKRFGEFGKRELKKQEK